MLSLKNFWRVLQLFIRRKILYSWAYQYYRRKLNGKQQKVYDRIYRCWFTNNRDIQLPPFLLDVDTASEVVQAVIKDHPEIFWVNYYRYTIRHSVLNDRLHFEFYFDDYENKQLSIEASSWKKRIVSKLPKHFSNRDEAWVLFDYLARQVTYGKQNDGYSQTIIGPMSKNNHISVCEGIAKSYKYLCDEAGIPCIIVFGDVNFGENRSGPHAWNIIDTGSELRHVDVTAELESAHYKGKASQSNFLYTDKDMKNYIWNRKRTPLCY